MIVNKFIRTIDYVELAYSQESVKVKLGVLIWDGGSKKESIEGWCREGYSAG